MLAKTCFINNNNDDNLLTQAEHHQKIDK